MPGTIDFTALKRGGFIKQRQADYFSVRLRVPAGHISATQLEKAAEAARKYGRGYLHLTTRQGLEIPWVRLESFQTLKDELAVEGIIPAGCGPRVRNVMACPGSTLCSHGLVDCRALAEELDEQFFGQELPIKKFKIAISGCPNSCSTPQINDVGLVGSVEPSLDADLCSACGLCVETCREGALTLEDDLPQLDKTRCANCGDCIAVCPMDAMIPVRTGYDLYVGGKIGRHPQIGTRVASFLTQSEAAKAVAKIVDYVQENGNQKERFGALLNRIGTAKLAEFLSA